MTRLEAVAGTDNPYSLNEVVGKGVLLAKAGGAVYVTACSQVEAEPRPHPQGNCTQEIPVSVNGTAMFADPITMVLRPTGQVLQCNDLAPARYQILGAWYCFCFNMLPQPGQPTWLTRASGHMMGGQAVVIGDWPLEMEPEKL